MYTIINIHTLNVSVIRIAKYWLYQTMNSFALLSSYSYVVIATFAAPDADLEELEEPSSCLDQLFWLFHPLECSMYHILQTYFPVNV